MLDDDELDDEPSPLAALLEKSPELQKLVMGLARDDLAERERELAEPRHPYIHEPNGPRQRKKRARRVLFDSLRAGRGREQACAAAGVDRETFFAWCERPEFYEAVLAAEHYEHVDADDDW